MKELSYRKRVILHIISIASMHCILAAPLGFALFIAVTGLYELIGTLNARCLLCLIVAFVLVNRNSKMTTPYFPEGWSKYDDET